MFILLKISIIEAPTWKKKNLFRSFTTHFRGYGHFAVFQTQEECFESSTCNLFLDPSKS